MNTSTTKPKGVVPRAANEAEIAAIAEAIRTDPNFQDMNDEDLRIHLSLSGVICFTNYVTGGPGYAGDVLVFLASGDHTIVNVLIRHGASDKLTHMVASGIPIEALQKVVMKPSLPANAGVLGVRPASPAEVGAVSDLMKGYEAYAHMDDFERLAHIESSGVAVVMNYMPGRPGYTGDVLVFVDEASPTFVVVIDRTGTHELRAHFCEAIDVG